MIRLTLVAFISVCAYAQTVNHGRTVVGPWDASGAPTTKPIKSGTALPATCSPGEYFFKTDAVRGHNTHSCVAANVWAQQGGGMAFNVKAYGAAGDGVADDTAAIQAAIDEAGVGNVVFVPAGDYLITNAITVPGGSSNKRISIIGAGRDIARFIVDPTFSLAANGVFEKSSGDEPGPVFDGFTVVFTQPDSADIGDYTQWPPAFYLPGTPRFVIRNVSVWLAWDGIDMTGNSGGALIENLWMSAFNVGIDVDGSLDTIRVSGLHFWPFGTSGTTNQANVFSGNSMGIRSGRADFVHISDSLFIGKLGVRLFQGATGPTGMFVSNTGFDAHSGIEVSAGTVSITGGYFTVSGSNRAILQTGGNVSIGGSYFGTGAGNSLSLIAVRWENGLGNNRFGVSNSYFQLGSHDIRAIDAQAPTSGNGRVHVLGNHFVRTPDNTYSNPTIGIDGTQRTTIIGNSTIDKGSGTGTFINVANDNFNRVTDNSFIGWSAAFPASIINGYYQADQFTHNPSRAHSQLGSPVNGTTVYCHDCTIANPCASGGTGAIAKRLNGAWVCN